MSKGPHGCKRAAATLFWTAVNGGMCMKTMGDMEKAIWNCAILENAAGFGYPV